MMSYSSTPANTSRKANDKIVYYEHINKIIDTYQFRKEEDRYSRCVAMEEIEINDYNLNISRYVSTAISEEEIDLTMVNSTLLEIEQKIAESTKKHNEFLKELGLPPLPWTQFLKHF